MDRLLRKVSRFLIFSFVIVYNCLFETLKASAMINNSTVLKVSQLSSKSYTLKLR